MFQNAEPNKQFTRQSFTIKQIFSFLSYIPFILLAIFCASLLLFISYNHNSIPQSITLTIASTNDLHGSYYPTIIKDLRSSEQYEYGGLAIMSSLINILKYNSQQYSIDLDNAQSIALKHQLSSNLTKPYFLYFDIGDQIQGSLQSGLNASKGQIMSDYYNHVGLNASALGNHQFDFGQEILFNYTNQLNNPIICSNFIDNRFYSHEKGYLPLKNQKKSHIFSFPTNFHQQKQLKIGVIGIITKQTSLKGLPIHYKILDYKNIVIEQSKKLKDEGVHAIILMSHAGNQCGKNKTYGLWQQDNLQNDYKDCRTNDEIFKLIDQLPDNTINAVLQGHRHSTSHFYYKNIPIVGSINNGYYLSALHLTFIFQKDLIKLQPARTKIEGPIPVCEKVFQFTYTCEFIPLNHKTQSGQKTYQNIGNLVQWQFHGIKVQKDVILNEIINTKWKIAMENFIDYKNYIAENRFTYPLQTDYNPNSYLGDLVSTLFLSGLRYKGQSLDIFINNPGGFRSVWYPGKLTYGNVYSMLTFQNTISFFEISGKNLKLLIQKIQNGNRRFFSVSGICQSFYSTLNKDDLAQNPINNVKNWGQLKLLSLSFPNNKPIIDTQVYKVGTYKYLVQGGGNFVNTSHLFSKVIHSSIDWRDLTIGQLKRREIINESILDEDKCLNGKRIMIRENI